MLEAKANINRSWKFYGYGNLVQCVHQDKTGDLVVIRSRRTRHILVTIFFFSMLLRRSGFKMFCVTFTTRSSTLNVRAAIKIKYLFHMCSIVKMFFFSAM